MRNHDLQRLYADLNVRFFGGRLPKTYRVVFSRQSGGNGGICLNDRSLIRLRPELLTERAAMHRTEPPEERVRRVLLHEMCHIGTLGHAKRWQAKMLRLAEMGEAWAAEEVKEYQKPTDMDWHGGIGQIKDALVEWANMEQRPDFRSVKRGASRIMFFEKVSDVPRHLPWLKAAWRNTCREVDRENTAREEFLRMQARTGIAR